MKTKPFLKAAAIALSIATISGISSTPMNSSAIAGVVVVEIDHDAKAIEIIEASIEALGCLTTTGTGRVVCAVTENPTHTASAFRSMLAAMRIDLQPVVLGGLQ